MRLKHLFEAPLPEDWDKDIYDQRVPFKKRVEYAKERAKQIGRGTSRVAFEIPYQGRPTILKVAINRKGMAQNAEEANIMDDYYTEMKEVTIPLIDYDTRNSQPTWLHTEKAQKVRSRQQLEKMIGMELMDLVNITNAIVRGREQFIHETALSKFWENEFAVSFMEIVEAFDLAPGDFARPANWGIYKGRPVLIDLGATNTVIADYYS